ncbi:cysteine-rich receptor-like protein kinase 44 isoform X2 [Magnolia sinica]|uniref:cysteine-rich receptor-like protein kinase 44 isoform X2 n=1 Tax=Magnolia sinica TaxID=86752 RepID=UPI002659BB1E|nr:cysteine-rich receptor-like protein kinase 44 isoform X2 [Magnolia sinica]
MVNNLILKPINLVLLTILPFLLQSPVTAQEVLLAYCESGRNYTSGSRFETNLNLLLSSLTTNGSINDFYNTTSGVSPDMVYGLAQCRDDFTTEACRNCLNISAVRIIQRCPNQKDATIRRVDCVLRYSDQRFFSQLNLDDSTWDYSWSGDNVSNPVYFNQQLLSLMINLSSSASSLSSKFATGAARLNNFENIYGMVQCTRDLSETDCYSCLRSMIGRIPSCCDSKEGARLATLSCFIRHSINLFFQASPPLPPSTDVNNTTGDGVNGGEIRSLETLLFDLETLKDATDDFSDANKLGEGGFGPVYKGKLMDGQEIAVKRLARTSVQGVEELKNEVVLVAKLQHRNLVRLLGCCLEGEEKMLVYEYVHNTSLDSFLFDPIKCLELNWERRNKIIVGIARGLVYLHEDSQIKIIHRDLKASNILLDKYMNPKISDFGLARLFGGDQTHGNTSRIAGTYGYMAPEYIIHGQFSAKTDAYSFGILVLELVTGRKTIGFRESESDMDLTNYTWRLWSQGKPLELIDENLGGNYEPAEVLRCIHIGLLCVQQEATARPTMSSVLLMLDAYSVTLPAPLRPAFFIGETNMEFDLSPTDSNFHESETDKSVSSLLPLSRNEASITELHPR